MIERSYMVQPTFQREWVEGRGLLIALAFFLGGLGGGLYLVSLYFDFYAGIVAAFFVVAYSLATSRIWPAGIPVILSAHSGGYC